METTTHLGDGGPVDHSTISSYWVSAAAATRTRAGLPDLTANRVAAVESYTRQALTAGGSTTWRYTETDTSYNDTLTSATYAGQLNHTYAFYSVATDNVGHRQATPTAAQATTLASLVEEVNRTRHDHIITLEDPIEYLLESTVRLESPSANRSCYGRSPLAQAGCFHIHRPDTRPDLLPNRIHGSHPANPVHPDRAERSELCGDRHA